MIHQIAPFFTTISNCSFILHRIQPVKQLCSLKICQLTIRHFFYYRLYLTLHKQQKIRLCIGKTHLYKNLLLLWKISLTSDSIALLIKVTLSNIIFSEGGLGVVVLNMCEVSVDRITLSGVDLIAIKLVYQWVSYWKRNKFYKTYPGNLFLLSDSI